MNVYGFFWSSGHLAHRSEMHWERSGGGQSKEEQEGNGLSSYPAPLGEELYVCSPLSEGASSTGSQDVGSSTLGQDVGASTGTESKGGPFYKGPWVEEKGGWGARVEGSWGEAKGEGEGSRRVGIGDGGPFLCDMEFHGKTERKS